MNIGEQIAHRRNAMNLSLSELSIKSGVQKDTIHKIEHSGNCRVDTLLKLMVALGGESMSGIGAIRWIDDTQTTVTA